MNEKLIASSLIFLVVGIGIGCGVSYTVYQPMVLEVESEVSNLNAMYDKLEANYTFLKSIGYTFNNTIQITDITTDIPLAPLETWCYVSGEVTNIGEITIKKLIIFVFQFYPDGSLVSSYPSWKSLENLYPNETLKFKISIGNAVEGQKIKILAVGNYDE